MEWKKAKEYRVIIVSIVAIAILVIGAWIILASLNGNGDFKDEPQEIYIVAKETIGGISASDKDGDKLSDIEEQWFYGTNQSNPDTDGDGMEDGWEAYHGRRNPVTGKLTLDPNLADAFGNPDGDGYDAYPVVTKTNWGIPIVQKGNGIFDQGDNLTSIEEYVGGSFSGIFEDLDPGIDIKKIAENGGYHLAWTLEYPSYPGDDIANELYKLYRPEYDEPVTTDPSDWDTDLDGIDDGYEYYFQDSINSLRSQDVFFPTGENEPGSWIIKDYDFSIDPLNPIDGSQDFDVRVFDMIEEYEGAEVLFFPDGLSCSEEYVYRTDPTKWDSDSDSYFDPNTGTYRKMDDLTEVTNTIDIIFEDLNGKKIYKPDSTTDWDHDGILDNRTNPNNPDTDGDLMPDGWELTFGLKPLNSSDRFQDIDGDGLQNYKEYSFPTYSTRWFTTDPFDPDTDSDGMPDGWEAFNAKLIQVDEDIQIELDIEDGIQDGIFMEFSVNPMIIDDEKDSDGSWYLNEATGDYAYTHTPDNLSNIEEWKTGYWLDGIVHGTWIPSGTYQSGTDPNARDTDGDGLLDGEELKQGFHGELIGQMYFSSPTIANIYYTNASNPDSDSDYDPDNSSRVLEDEEEIMGMNKEIMPDNGWDDDKDGIIDEQEGEYLHFKPTNATNPDTDLEGLDDVDELFGIWTGKNIPGDPTSGFGWIRTDPNHKDTDLDGINDGLELEVMVNSQGSFKPFKTNPLDSDTDDDGLEDGLEWLVDFYPYKDFNVRDNWDLNEDGDLLDDNDIFNTRDTTNPRLSDTDGDGLEDGWEYKWGATSDRDLIEAWLPASSVSLIPEGMTVWIINPLDPNDVFQDPDGDRLTNWEEFQNGTDPLNWDTDGDGMADYWEIEMAQWAYDEDEKRWGWNLDPLDPEDWCEDPDKDGVTFALWTDTGTAWEYIEYYFPWCNLYEYQKGFNLDGDNVNEVTSDPNEFDSEGDKLPDGFEYFYSDLPFSAPPWDIWEDNDGLPAGWESFFNGTLWNQPEVYPREYIGGTWKLGRIFGPPGAWRTGNGDIAAGQFDPSSSDSDGDGQNDGSEDPDGDGFTNFQEYLGHTDPTDTKSRPGVGRSRKK